jgi:membrane-associated protein
MSLLAWLLHTLRDPGGLVAYGYPVLALVILTESAIFPLLPGDSLLVVAGIYAAKGDLSVVMLSLLLIPAAILGNVIAYYLGRQIGPRLFSRPDSRVFKPAYAEKAHAFYERHGGAAIVIARFVPIVRTFVPVVAGIGGMRPVSFFSFNVAGGIAWILSMTLGGYFLGGFATSHGFPLERHIEKVIVVVVFLSLLPGIIEYFRSRRRDAVEAATKSGMV